MSDIDPSVAPGDDRLGPTVAVPLPGGCRFPGDLRALDARTTVVVVSNIPESEMDRLMPRFLGAAVDLGAGGTIRQSC